MAIRDIWRPEAVIFVGLQGSGKSTFYLERFFRTHIRINLDMLKTRQREARLLTACIDMQQHFVVDNTNPTRAERERYVDPARRRGFRIVGYVFTTGLGQCLERNARRSGKAQVPARGIVATARRMQPPRIADGFDELHAVVATDERFDVQPWLEPTYLQKGPDHDPTDFKA